MIIAIIYGAPSMFQEHIRHLLYTLFHQLPTYLCEKKHCPQFIGRVVEVLGSERKMVQVMKLVGLDPGLLVFPHYIHLLESMWKEKGIHPIPSIWLAERWCDNGQAAFHKLNVDWNSVNLDWAVLLAENRLLAFCLILVDWKPMKRYSNFSSCINIFKFSVFSFY